MDVILSAFNRTVTCLEGIVNDIECQIDSGCCQTHKQIHTSEHKDDEINSEIKEKDLKK